MTLTEHNEVPETGALFNFGEIASEELEPKLWIKSDEIIDLSCGDEFVVIITKSGRAFSYGKNEWGQLGLGDTKTVLDPSCIKALKEINEKAAHVACGRYHTLISTESQKLFGFGCNNEGQLGLDPSKSSVTRPTDITSWKYGNIKQIAAGGAFSAVINESGFLYVWGSNTESQLGLGDLSDENVYVPTKVSFFSTPVSFVACGNYHTSAISQKKLYMWGEMSDDKLGGDFKENQSIPQLILENTAVKQVSCGHNHTICLSENGDVYVWGRGDSGQLGCGPHELTSRFPKLLDVQKLSNFSQGDRKNTNEKFIHVSAGENHTAIISVRGLAYSFGDGRHGKLGNVGGASDYSNYMCPKLIAKLSKEHWIYNVQCGGCHTVVLARNRKSNEQIDDLISTNMLQSLDENTISSFSETATNSSSLRARSNRRKKIKIVENNLPILTPTSPISDEKFQRENGNVTKDVLDSSNEINEKITFVQTRSVESAPKREINSNSILPDAQNKDITEKNGDLTELEKSQRRRRESFDRKVEHFAKLMDKACDNNSAGMSTNPDKKADVIIPAPSDNSDEESMETEDKLKVGEENKSDGTIKSKPSEITNVGCLANCRKNQSNTDPEVKGTQNSPPNEPENITPSNQGSKSCILL